MCSPWPRSVCVSLSRSPAWWGVGAWCPCAFVSRGPGICRHFLWPESSRSRSRRSDVLGVRHSGTRSCDCLSSSLAPGGDVFSTRACWCCFRGDGRGSRGHAAPLVLVPCSARWECPARHITSGFCFAALVLSHVPKPPQHRGCGGSGRRRQEAGWHPPNLVVWLWNSSDLQQQTGISPLCLPGQAVPARVSPSSAFASIFLR